MLKPNANFRLNKQAKRFMATIIDPHQRGEFKRASIQAQLYSEQAPKREPKRGKGPVGEIEASE